MPFSFPSLRLHHTRRENFLLLLIESAILFRRFRDNVVEKMILKHFVCFILTSKSSAKCLLSLRGVICQFHFIYFYSFYLLLSEKMFFFFLSFLRLFAPQCHVQLPPQVRVEGKMENSLNDDDSTQFVSLEQKAISNLTERNTKLNKYFFRFVYLESKCKFHQGESFSRVLLIFQRNWLEWETTLRVIIFEIYEFCDFLEVFIGHFWRRKFLWRIRKS